MTTQYIPAGLDRLYQAIKEQAEHEFIMALYWDYPGLTEQGEAAMLKTYRRLRAQAEQRIIALAEKQETS